MKQMAFIEFQRMIELRKAAIGFDESAASVDARRNKGAMRTAGKRELLRRTKARAKAASVAPVVSY